MPPPASLCPSSFLLFSQPPRPSSSLHFHPHLQLQLQLISTPLLSLLPAPHSRARSRLLVRAEQATLPVLSFQGDRVGSASLDLRSAPPSTARAVVHRALITDQQNSRRGTASTLTRGEVRGGGKKPYQQKKTGRARRGSQRTPLRPGGGVIFGPKPRDWSIKINRKEKRLAISTALSSAASAADAFVIEDFDDQFADGPKTRDFVATLKRWGLDPSEKALLLTTELPHNVWLSGRNIGTLKMLTPRTLNLFDILDARKLVFTRSAVDYLNERYGDYAYEDTDDEDDQDTTDGALSEEAAPGKCFFSSCTVGTIS
jgi:large subunit ribosomal protein L4